MEALKNGHFKVDILYGYNKDEGSLFANNISEPEYTIVHRIMGEVRAKEYLKRFPVNKENLCYRKSKASDRVRNFYCGNESLW